MNAVVLTSSRSLVTHSGRSVESLLICVFFLAPRNQPAQRDQPATPKKPATPHPAGYPTASQQVCCAVAVLDDPKGVVTNTIPFVSDMDLGF